jgi:hypothetical protein
MYDASICALIKMSTWVASIYAAINMSTYDKSICAAINVLSNELVPFDCFVPPRFVICCWMQGGLCWCFSNIEAPMSRKAA